MGTGAFVRAVGARPRARGVPMDRPPLWHVVLMVPGEDEVALLADLSRRKDVRVVGVVDPTGEAVATTIAEVMGIPIHRDFTAPDLRAADTVVHPDKLGESRGLMRAAEQLGFVPLASSEFRRLLSPPPVFTVAARPAPRHAERLERETESIHRTLSRIEEALHRESLLRWLLSLATRAVRATAGSLMLYDEKSEQLYVAGAFGLSESTLHRTRVSLGQGIAGRVAQKLRSELVVSRPEPGEPRDRPEIAAAISAPLVHEGRLLGVLNVNVATGDRLLDGDDLATIDRLARRLGLILHRFLGIQRARESALFQAVDHELQESLQSGAPLEECLGYWAGILGLRLGAARLQLALVCEDGSLLTAEKPLDGPAAVAHEPPDNAAWQEVLQTGRPLVVRELPAEDGAESSGATIFYLPVGNAPVAAVLTVAFTASAEAHRFHDVSGEAVYLLERRLPELISRLTQRDRLERFAALTGALTEIATAAADASEAALELLAAAARRLTGAETAHVVAELVDGQPRLAAPAVGAPPAWLAPAGRLLAETQTDGWRSTLLSDTTDPRPRETCLLAVTAGPGQAAPGLLLHGKQRLHPLDGASFTEFDAELAGRLARLLPGYLRARPAPAPVRPAVPPGEGAAPEAASARAARQAAILDFLRREMDRCDRYHTAFSLSVLRPAPPAAWSADEVDVVVQAVRAKVRSSDFVAGLDDGSLVLLAPEEVQAIARLERRLRDILRELSGRPDLAVVVGRVLYPGRQDDPEGVLAAAVAALEPLP